MNEDELRAFLESATVGGDDEPDDIAEVETTDAESEPPAAAASSGDSLNLPPTEPIDIPQRRAANPAPTSDPSFDELLGIRRAESGPQPQVDAQVLPPAGPAESELAPLVLPAPPTRRSTYTAPTPAPTSPATTPTPTPTTPLAQAPTAAMPVAAAPQPASASASSGAPTTPIGATPNNAASSNAPSNTAASSNAAPFSASQLANDLGFDAILPVDDGYEKIEVTGGERERPRFVPWIIVGAVAVVAIVASLLIVLSVRGTGNTEVPTAAPTNTSDAPTTPTTPEEEPTPTDEPTEEPTTPGDDAPDVDPGDTGKFPIPDWNLTGQISAKFGWPQYRFEDQGKTLVLSGGTLLPKFPDSCAEMREGFGLTRLDDGTLEVYRPAETCAEATELYDQVWGLVAATIPTFKKS